MKIIQFFEFKELILIISDLLRTMGWIMATIENGRNGEASYEKLMMNKHDT